MIMPSARISFSGMAMLAFSVAVSSVQAQSPLDIPEALQDKALTVTVQTQVSESPSAPAWEAKEVKSTLPGSSVSVKLVGESLVVLVQVTPYENPEGLLLVTQAQVWIRDQDRIHYHTVLNTIKIAYGDPVVFYPLGEGKGKAPLRVVIVVNPFEKTSPESEPAADQKKAP